MSDRKQLFEKKFKNPYKTRVNSSSTKDVDLESRTVSGMFNSYFFIDSDEDMLLPGAAAKSINERGAGSKKGNKIKHLKDHEWGSVIARLDVLDEREVDFEGKKLTGIYHESFYPESNDSNDQLIKIQEGLIDDRSIGFRYMDLAFAEKDSTLESERQTWDQFYPLALNPEKADRAGFFWAVKEIKLFEGSDVAFGANELTPMLGMKSEAEKVTIVSKLCAKLDTMTALFKNGNLTDEGFHVLEMESLQIKSYIASIVNSEPSVKDTLNEGRNDPDTHKKKDDAKTFLQYLT